MRANNGHVVGGSAQPSVVGWEGHVWNGTGWDVAWFMCRREAKVWVKAELEVRGLPRLTGVRGARRRSARWTKAMRRKAAEDGRKGSKAAKARGGQLGGLISWGTRTDIERERILDTLRAGRQAGRQTNKSPKARAAQKVRGVATVRAQEMSAAQAEWLHDRGMLGGVWTPVVVETVTSVGAGAGAGAGRPRKEDYATTQEWLRAVDAWDQAAWKRLQRGGGDE